MNLFLTLSIIGLITSAILLILEPRNFFAAVILVISILGVFLYFLIIFSNKYPLINVFSTLFFFALIPLLIVLAGIFLIKNGKVMKQKEGRHLANRLSLYFGLYAIVVGSGILFILFEGYYLNSLVYIVLVSALIISLYFGFLFAVYLIYSYAYQKIPLRRKIDYIIVLGCGLIGDKVSPLLKNRLDKSIEVYKNQLEKGASVKIIVSGGKGHDEVVSEACAMKNYLLSQNIPDKDILLEDKSTTTYENMLYSKKIMESISKNYRCTFVSNNYHIFRASIYARKAGIRAYGIGSPTSFYFLPSALIREFIAIVFLYKIFHIILLILFSLYVLSSFLPI